jgi:hypothetical protein
MKMGRPRKFTDTEKWCPDCVLMLPHSKFYKNAGNKSDGLAPYCKKHFDFRRRKQLLASLKQQENKKKRDARYRERHRDRINMHHRMWTHGLDPDQYKKMYEEQNGLCAFSGCLNSAEDIDHDHETQVVRKLLCHKHNMAIGLFDDNSQMLREAADYIDSYKVKTHGELHDPPSRNL